MGTNYYFIPRKFDMSKIKKVYDDYSNKLENLLKDYTKEYNNLFVKMQEGTENIFGKQQLPEPEDWHNYLFLAEIDYPRLHICKSSGGWKPLFQKTDFYSSVRELKEFYNKNKDKICIEDEYGEEQNIDKLFEFIDSKYKDDKNQSHIDTYKDKDGYEWSTYDFS